MIKTLICATGAAALSKTLSKTSHEMVEEDLERKAVCILDPQPN